MVDYIELQYATMISGRLPKFKIKSTSPYRINFRCPFCGDSKKSPHKARGWLLEDKHQHFHYFCHNCGVGHNFPNFLKHLDGMAYKEYITTKFIEKTKYKSPLAAPSIQEEINGTEQENPALSIDVLKKIKKISQLPFDHPVKKYIEKRQIPPNQHHRLFYAPKFKTWIDSFMPGKLDEKVRDEPRLIMPFMDEKNKCFGVSARSFDPNGLRYITLMFDTSKPKIFGLDKVDFNKPYFVVEGALDSLFLPNAVAMAGADGNSSGLKNIENATYVFDNEPRNKEIHKRMEKLIKENKKVCIWRSDIAQKDINEMYMAGLRDIDKIIEKCTYQGLAARLKLTGWKKT